LKVSSATSARAKAPRPTVRSSVKRRPTPTNADDFALAGPSDLPDPDFHAYRKDLADIALAGRVIASHYAEPVEREIIARSVLRAAPSDEAQAVGELAPGEPFAMLDESLGWAWGYAGEERRVGYLRVEALGLMHH
jgi:hypothetical protein